MITNHRSPARPPHPQHLGRRRLDFPSLFLALIGLIFGAVAYCLITVDHVNALVIVPSIVAVTLGLTHLIKREAPRE